MQRKKIDRVELLYEISKTDTGKFFIVVFKRFLKKKKAASPIRAGTDLGNYGADNTDIFNDIYVKEIQWIQAIQLLKRFDNDLEKFINAVVKYNSRFEKIDFSLLHRQLVEMGDLRKLQMKEGQHIINQKYATSENAYAERPLAIRRKTKRVK